MKALVDILLLLLLLSLQLCPTLCDPIDSSPPGSSIPGILQARILEWVAISFSTMEYYSAIKRSAFKSVLMRWTNLEPIIQSEVSQKEKYKYRILTHIYGPNLQLGCWNKRTPASFLFMCQVLTFHILSQKHLIDPVGVK